MFPANNRFGRVKVTSLLMLVVIAGAVYYAMAFGKVYWHRYAIRNAMDEQLSYTGQLADETIRQQLVDDIADLHLPPAASRVQMFRPSPRTIQVSIAYTEKVNLLFTTKNIPVSITERRSY
ncbi:MAG: hypothetical protein OER21_13485 [Gemmatimonadota bacterium]|nr:hypothetical protein [Gemmatimonadota bacterium]